MLLNKAVQLCAVAAFMWLGSSEARSSTAVKLCGRKLSDFMSRICQAYNSPPWDVPIVVEQPTAVRKKRQTGIADECCTEGCTWEQLTEYCAVTAYSESPFESPFEPVSERGSSPAAMATQASHESPRSTPAGREVGRRRRGYGRARARGRRCGCRGRRRASTMGNTKPVVSVVRDAPVVGTVSPLITWGRTLNTDLPPSDRDRYAYIAVYNPQ